MLKPWRVFDPVCNEEEDFATEAEALAHAEGTLAMYRAESACEGEWPEEIDQLRIYKMTHHARITDTGTTELGEWAEYQICQAP